MCFSFSLFYFCFFYLLNSCFLLLEFVSRFLQDSHRFLFLSIFPSIICFSFYFFYRRCCAEEFCAAAQGRGAMLQSIAGRPSKEVGTSHLEVVGCQLLNCVKPTHETLFPDLANINIENSTTVSKDRKPCSSNRPSLRCQPLSGRVPIK